jgi:enoyl-CoA hydratase/carnithine racemase
MQTNEDGLAAKPLTSPVPRLSATVSGPVGTLAIDNPAKRNALDLAMWTAIPGLLRALAQEPGVRVIVIRGAGSGAFASGADIAEFETVRATADGGRAYEAANEAAFEAVSACPRPVIAMVRGFCLGGGLGLALACDLRVASGGAVFGIPAARLGLGYPPRAMAQLVAVAGAALAKDLLFTARRINAEEALANGLLNRLVPDDSLEAETTALADAIAANAPLTISAAKRAIDAAAGLPGSPGAEDLAALASACFDSDDYREGRAAFLGKRRPSFQGR